jgi:DNA-binding beta-propeller fold protein YncE
VNDNGESETNPHGITFSKSGTKMFMTGNADDVFEYDLTNAYCIGNISTPSKKDIEIDGVSGNPTGIVFDSSGTKLFVVDKHSDMVYQYVVDVPWRAIAINSTAGDSSHCYCNPISFSISGQEATPEGITFDASGTKMFIVGSEGTNKGEVNTYNLAEPYLVTSASHASVYTMSFTDANPSGITFSNSGTKMFISDQGTDTIRGYVLEVPYITSSNSTGDANTPSLSMSGVGGSVRDLWFDATGTKLFILEQGAKDVTVYKLTVPFLLSSATIVS